MINERVKELRKELNLTMEKFGERLGVKKNSISQIESGNRNLTEQMFLAICREFGVNEEWLRDGEGEMFVEPAEFSLDDFCKKRGMSELELGILKAFFNIPQEIRKQALDYFVGGFQELDLDLPVLKDKKASLEDLYRATGVNKDLSKNLILSETKQNTETYIEKEQFLKLAEEQFDKEKERELRASFAKESDAG